MKYESFINSNSRLSTMRLKLILVLFFLAILIVGCSSQSQNAAQAAPLTDEQIILKALENSNQEADYSKTTQKSSLITSMTLKGQTTSSISEIYAETFIDTKNEKEKSITVVNTTTNGVKTSVTVYDYKTSGYEYVMYENEKIWQRVKYNKTMVNSSDDMLKSLLKEPWTREEDEPNYYVYKFKPSISFVESLLANEGLPEGIDWDKSLEYFSFTTWINKNTLSAERMGVSVKLVVNLDRLTGNTQKTIQTTAPDFNLGLILSQDITSVDLKSPTDMSLPSEAKNAIEISLQKVPAATGNVIKIK